MERVKKGERYWYIDESFTVQCSCDIGTRWDSQRFKCGNYFHTREEAEAVARKFRAVLKGADVIEMPSEEEMQTLETKDIVLAEFIKESHSDLDMIMHGRHAYWKGWNAAICWLKSKIVK